ncbi:MAG: PEP-CTERM sorting domain-containing protein [Candidatus Zixiibacteriota bacterium]
MKKLILIALVAVMIVPMTSYGFGFLNITGAQLERLDTDSYRLRVSYDWGGAMLPALLTPTNEFGPPTPTLQMFDIAGGGSAYNFFSLASKNSWTGKGDNASLKNTGNQFGFDFDAADPLATRFDFSSHGVIEWLGSNQIGGSLLPATSYFSETFDSRFSMETTPSAVPEPATAALLGLGLLGVVLYRKRK